MKLPIDFRRFPSTFAPSSGDFSFRAYICCPSIIFKTVQQISMKFCTQLMGQEWAVPIDFRWIPSTDAPSSGIFVFSFSFGMVVRLSIDYLQNCFFDFDLILHTAYWPGEEVSFRFSSIYVNRCPLLVIFSCGAFICCLSVIFKTALQISVKFCILLNGQETMLPVDFWWFPSSDAPSRGNV